jgi:Hydrolase of X-linked nucleoside diphosphate N terminal
MSIQPDWLIWARKLQALAQTGLTYAQNPYDNERYRQLQNVSAQWCPLKAHVPAPRTESDATPACGASSVLFRTTGARRLRSRWTRHRWRSARGKHVSTARIRPAAPSLIAKSGSGKPRRLRLQRKQSVRGQHDRRDLHPMTDHRGRPPPRRRDGFVTSQICPREQTIIHDSPRLDAPVNKDCFVTAS